LANDKIDPVKCDHVDYDSKYYEADQDVSLKVMNWKPVKKQNTPPIIFVAGWVSVVEGWADFIKGASKNHEVFYLETREKRSARINSEKLVPDDFSIYQMALDITNVIKKLPVKESQAMLIGSSLGATSILEAMKSYDLNPLGAFLIGPNSDFKVPVFLKPVAYLPSCFFQIVKYPILWYLQLFRVDAKNEPEQIRRYKDTVLKAHPKRIKLSAISLLKYQVWLSIEGIKAPVGLAFAPTDKLHASENILQMEKLIPNASLFECPSNKHMHSHKLMIEIESFIESITVLGKPS